MKTRPPTQLEAHALGREQILQAIDGLAPGVKGNPFIPEWPTPRQLLFLGLHRMVPSKNRVFQALYGGAAGGGKSSALLMAMAQMAWLHPDFSGICFRRSYTDLIQPGALLDRAMKWWIPQGAAWSGTSRQFRFPNGAQVSMSYLWGPQDHLRYQGAEYHMTAWDEMTQWETAAQYEYVGLSRVRRKAGCEIPLRTLSTSNPGGPGHDWVKRMFIGGTDQSGEWQPAQHYYVPATLADNPHLDRSVYEAGLASLHPTVREQLLRGNWDARDPGDYFRREWFGPLLDPETDRWASHQCIRIRWWDLAASEKPEAARTAGVRMARHRSGSRVVEHCTAFRATPGKRDDLIVQTAQADGHNVVVGVEIEGGSGGIAQFLALEKRLKSAGFRVVGARPQEQNDREQGVVIRNTTQRAAKAMRADPVASCLERGYIRRGESEQQTSGLWGVDADKPPEHHKDGLRCMAGSWTQAYLDELIGFPEGHLCDVVDATSGAWSWLEAHAIGFAAPPAVEAKQKPTSQDAHPEDRSTRLARRWDPL